MNKMNCIAIGVLLLLGAGVFTVGRKDGISSKKRSAISCGSAQPAGEHPWPGNDNSGNGCTHQTVTAALFGRLKRDKMHAC
jgi:hypothetical protein